MTTDKKGAATGPLGPPLARCIYAHTFSRHIAEVNVAAEVDEMGVHFPEMAQFVYSKRFPRGPLRQIQSELHAWQLSPQPTLQIYERNSTAIP
jgi:hypothetical protein